MKSNKIVAGFAMALTVLLAGCGSGPSEGEIEKIFKAEAEQAAQQMKSLGAGAMAKSFVPTLHSVKKIGCEKNGAGVLCDLELDVEQNGTRNKGEAALSQGPRRLGHDEMI